MRMLTLACISISLLTAVPGTALPSPAGFQALDLGDLGGKFGNATPAAINDLGQVCGTSDVPGINRHAFFWSPSGGMVDLGTIGGNFSSASAINSKGEVAGVASLPGDEVSRAFFWKAGSPMRDLGTLPGLTDGTYNALAISNNSVVVGVYYAADGGAKAWRWTAALGMKELPGLGGTYTEASAINTGGTVVGTSQLPTGESHAVSWTPAGAVKDLGHLGGGWSSAVAINDAGQIAGNSDPGIGTDHAFFYDKNKMTDLGSLSGPFNFSIARAINSLGHVIGTSGRDYPDPTHAFLWTKATGMRDLGELEPGAMTEAFAVNASDRVVGYSIFQNGWRAFVWDPSAGMRNLGTLNYNSYAIGVNASGKILGYSENGTGFTRTFLATTPGNLEEIGTLGGGRSAAYAVNAAGDVVGDSYSPSGFTHAFHWSAGTMLDLGSVGNRHSRAVDINANGEVVAVAGVTEPYEERAFYWSRTTGKIEIPGLGGELWHAVKINRFGQVAGNSFTPDGDMHAFLWTRTGGTIDLGTPGEDSFASSINDDGHIVGYRTNRGTGELRAFVWKPGAGMRDLGTGAQFARDINNRGEIAGWGQDENGVELAFLWKGHLEWPGNLGLGGVFVYDLNENGTLVGHSYNLSSELHGFAGRAAPLRDLGTLGGTHVFSEARAVNDSEEIVGVSGERDSDDTFMRAFIVRGPGPMTDLGALGGVYSVANAINSQGQVVGQAERLDGARHAVRWNTR